MKRTALSGWKKWSIITIICIIMLEVTIRMFHIDLILIKPSLYYQGTHQSIYRNSENPGLLYEPIPGGRLTDLSISHSSESKEINKENIISINSLGFRGKYPESIETNRTRIIIIGGSNTYGAIVSDNETYPHLLQALLDERYPGRFEVINAGRNAYVNSQKAILAYDLVERFNPDMIILQVLNSGRRAFLIEEEYKQHFKNNEELYNENIPLLITDDDASYEIHHSIIRVSGLYRTIAIMINMRIMFHWERCKEKGSGIFCPEEDIDFHNNYRTWRYPESLSERYMEEFFSEYDDIPIIILDSIYRKFCNIEWDGQSNPRYYSLCFDTDDEEYKDGHPRSYVYEDYALRIAGILENDYPELMKET